MLYRLSAASLLLAVASAQTFTDCNPMNKTCPDDPALGKTLDISSFSSTPSEFTVQSSDVTYSNGEALLTINKEGQAPTLISNFYMFFGSIEVVMKAAKGVGIVSSVVLESDDLDEIDLEWLGGNTAQVETNYFGKGDTSTYNRATYVPVATPQDTYHNYTITWSEQTVNWIVDNNVVRTLNYNDANGGNNFPQTPMKLRIGCWAGGDPKNPPGTITWAGGKTDFGQAPFTMNVKSIKAIDASSGSSYHYSDNTGSYKSIKVIQGKGPAANDNAPASSGSAAPSSTAGSSNSSATAMYSTYTTTICSTSTTAASSATGTPPAPPASGTSTGPAAVKTGAASVVGVSGLALFGAAALMVLGL